MTGKGSSGSWKIRGAQLGRAMNADATPDIRNPDAYDLAIIVKRYNIGLIERLHRAKTPIVWDVVDAWPQPHGNLWDRNQCMAWLEQQFNVIRPVGIVAATKAMADDCVMFGVPVLWLPHHADPTQRLNPIREKVKVVGYQGGVNYLGKWGVFLNKYCAAQGWQFKVNPGQLADLDIVVALRDQDGYGPMNWKSNVKLANAQATGTPCIVHPEAGYIETMSGAEFVVEDVNALALALQSLKSYDFRKSLAPHLLGAARTLNNAAKEYTAWLNLLMAAKS